MEIQFSEHSAHNQETIYFATDRNQNDVYINEVRNNYHLSNSMLYALHACDNTLLFHLQNLLILVLILEHLPSPLPKLASKR